MLFEFLVAAVMLACGLAFSTAVIRKVLEGDRCPICRRLGVLARTGEIKHVAERPGLRYRHACSRCDHEEWHTVATPNAPVDDAFTSRTTSQR